MFIMKLWSLLLPTGLMFVSFLPKGTSDCIDISLDETGQIVVAVVPDCVCDPSCDVCAYYGEEILSGPEDCFSCPEDLVFTLLYSDGSGTCTAADDSIATITPTTPDTSTASPDDGTGDDSTSTPTGRICVMLYQLAGMYH